MLMTSKQIVTFELAIDHTPLELMVRLALDAEKIRSILNRYKERLEEIVIINTDKRIIFYIYTDDYTPLLELFQGHDIAPEHFKLLVNTKQSNSHLSRLISRFESNYSREEKILRCLKEAFEMSQSAGSLGTTLEPFIANAITTYQLIRKESILGKISINFISLAIDEVGRRFGKKALSKINYVHDSRDAINSKNT